MRNLELDCPIPYTGSILVQRLCHTWCCGSTCTLVCSIQTWILFAAFFPPLSVKLFHPNQYTHIICGLNGVLSTHCHWPSGFSRESPRKYKKCLSKNWIIKFCIKNVNTYKYICIYRVIDVMLGKEERGWIDYSTKVLASDWSVFISCFCCLLYNVSQCLNLIKA